MNYINKLLRKTGSGEAVQEPTIRKQDQTGHTEASPETTPRRLTFDSDQTTDYESACEGDENPSNLTLLAEELKSVHISTPRALAPLKKFPYSPPEKDLFINDNVPDENIEKTENLKEVESADPLSLVSNLNETSLCLDFTLDETIRSVDRSQLLSIKENLSPNLKNFKKTLDGSLQEEFFYDSKNFFGADDELNLSKKPNIPLETSVQLNLFEKSEFSDVSYDSLDNSILKRPETSFAEESVITPKKDSHPENQTQSPEIKEKTSQIFVDKNQEAVKPDEIEDDIEKSKTAEETTVKLLQTEITENGETSPEKPPQQVADTLQEKKYEIIENLEAGDSSSAPKVELPQLSRNKEVESEKRKEVETDKPEEVETEKPEQVETKKPEKVETEKPEQVETEKLEQVETDKPEEVETEKPEQVETEKPEQVETEKLEQVETDKPEEVETEKPEQVETEKPEQVETEKPEQVKTEKPEQVETEKPEQVEGPQKTDFENTQVNIDEKRVLEDKTLEKPEIESENVDIVLSEKHSVVDISGVEENGKSKEEIAEKVYILGENQELKDKESQVSVSKVNGSEISEKLFLNIETAPEDKKEVKEEEKKESEKVSINNEIEKSGESDLKVPSISENLNDKEIIEKTSEACKEGNAELKEENNISDLQNSSLKNDSDLKEPRKSEIGEKAAQADNERNQDAHEVDSLIENDSDSRKEAKKSIETSLNDNVNNSYEKLEGNEKEPKKSKNESNSETESSIALGGSDFPNSFCDTISETFSPQACDLSRLEFKLDEKLTLTQALTDETILGLKNKEYSEEYFSITEAVNEREKLNGPPNNRSLSVINEESFLISSSDTELFKSDSTSLASSFREDSLEPDLNPISREDSLEPSTLFGRTLNSMEKSYNSLQEIYETCSKQERELGCSDVVEPVLFNLSISAEAKRLADDFSKMDLTSETLKDVKPPQHMMHSVNSSEAGPVTADEDFKKTDKFCNATDFDFEAIDKFEKGDQNKTALPRDSIFLKFDPLFQHIQKEADQSIMSDHDPEKTVIENKTPQKEPLRVNAVTPINREKRASNSSPNSGTKTPGSDFLSKEIAKLQELMLQQEAAHQHVALESEEKTERIEQLKRRVAELESRDPNVGLEGKLKQLEAENAKLKKDLNTTKTENKQLVNVMEEYEKTISQLMASKEEMQNEYEKVKEKIAMERDDAVSHLNNLEVAFSDVHLKYEKSKTIIEQLHNNEKLMNESLQEHVKIIAKKNANYEKLKVHATEKLAAANQEIANLTNTHKMEITKLNASNKRAELTIKSLEEALEQKKSEIRELTQICDELIGTTTAKN